MVTIRTTDGTNGSARSTAVGFLRRIDELSLQVIQSARGDHKRGACRLFSTAETTKIYGYSRFCGKTGMSW